MSKRTNATDFTILGKDETGATIDLGYICPYCHNSNGGVIFTGASANNDIDSNFETDQICDWCGKDIIVECRY